MVRASCLRRSLNAAYRFAGFAAALCVIAVLVLILAQMGARMMKTHIPSSGDFIRLFTIWASFLGLAYTMHHQAHIRVGLFVSRLSRAKRRVLNVCVGGLACLMLGAFCWFFYQLIAESYEYQDVTDGEIVLPLWPMQLPVLIGLALFSLSMLDYTITEIFNPAAHETDELIGDGS